MEMEQEGEREGGARPRTTNVSSEQLALALHREHHF